jgi:hypothetical protein
MGTATKLPVGYFHSVDVMDCINMTEYIALKTADSDVVDFIISAGFVNLNTGSNSRLKLKEYFPTGKTTNTNLSTLIGSPL